MKKKVQSLVSIIFVLSVVFMMISPVQATRVNAATSPVEIVAEYSYQSMFCVYHFIIVRSTSDKPLTATSNTTAYDAAGNIVGAESGGIEVIRAGHDEMIMEMYDGTAPATYQTQLSSSVCSYVEDAAASVIVQPTISGDKVIFTCTNAGTIPAEFFNVSALFFKNGQLVGHNYTYVIDADDELKAGSTMSGELDCYESSFDNVLIYTSGRYYTWG